MSAAQPVKPLIGLTGGIASGKSTVSQQLAKLGVIVIDADVLAREVVAKGSDGLREVLNAFGPELLTAEGTLDRERMAALVFRDADARKRLNAIVHPRIGQLSAQLVVQAQSAVTPYVVYEAPLLVETGAHRGMSALIVVAAASELQVTRVMTRDGMTDEAARARIAAQLPLETKIAAADYVIHNDTDRQALIDQTLHVHQAILKRFGLS